MTGDISSTMSNVVRVERWPSEIPLKVFIILITLGVWCSLALFVVGLLYALAIGLFLFITHMLFIAHIRGSAVRLGPDQFPDLSERVLALARRAGIRKMPEVYLLQADGILNALATRFLRSRMVILFSDLLEACGDDAFARDMIIGHELGHLRAGHLEWTWLLCWGKVVPILGTLYSQACEYTSDRYGAALCGAREGALRGLAILAAGRGFGPRINLSSFVRQEGLLQTGLMTLGSWLSSHPPLCRRIAALEPSLSPRISRVGGTLRAILVLLVGITLSVAVAAGAVTAVTWITRFM